MVKNNDPIDPYGKINNTLKMYCKRHTNRLAKSAFEKQIKEINDRLAQASNLPGTSEDKQTINSCF